MMDMLFIMVDMPFIALPASLFAKRTWSLRIICLFLFMAKRAIYEEEQFITKSVYYEYH